MEAGGVPTRERSQVSEPDRRNAKRREVLKPASLKFTYEIVELTARTVDVSREGVSLEALGRIPLLMDVEGKKYLGCVVRAVPMDAEWTAYAIALDDDFDI